MTSSEKPFDLAGAVKAATPGDVITVPPGEYGAVILKGAKGVKIRGEGATLAGLTLSACEDVAVEDLSVRLKPDASTVSSTSAVRVVQSRGVVLSGLTIRCGLAVAGLPQDTDPNLPRSSVGDAILGLPIGRGLTIDGCSAVIVSACDIGVSHKGIVLNNSRNLRLDRNDIHDTRTGQISGAGVSDILIEANWLRNSRPWKFGGRGDHGDFIHLWTDPRYQTAASAEITIRDNLIDQGEGFPILGIYLDDNRDGLGFRAVRIEGNLILNGNGQGIRLERTQGVVMNNRAVQTSGGPGDAPSIRLWDECDVTIAGNVMADVYGAIKVAGAIGANTVKLPAVDLAEAVAEREGWLAKHRPKPATPEPDPEVIELTVKPGQTVIIRGAV